MSLLKSEIAIIAAFSKNRVIGNKGHIPWNIFEDKKRFKELTTDNVVIMGRKTFEDILNLLKKPLPNRINLVLSKTKNFSTEDFLNDDSPLSSEVKTFSDLQSAVNFAKEKYPLKKIFICGGEKIFEEAISFCNKMYLTKIDADFEGDAFFPKFDEKEFKVISEKSFDEIPPYKFVELERK